MQKNLFKIAVLLIATIFTTNCFSQSVSINSNGTVADSTAILDISSTTKGLLVPRMTTEQRTGIANPATGLLVYQTDINPGFYYYNGSSWFLLIDAAVTNRQQTLLYTIKGF